MSARSRSPRRAPLATLLALLVGVWSVLVPAVAPPAHAVEQEVRVTLTGVRMTDDTLTLTGTATNTGTEPLVELTARLWRSTGRLHSTAAIEGAVAAKNTTEGTSRPVEPANATAVVPEDTALEPGASTGFSVSGTLRALGLAQPDASYWVGVDVTGQAEGGPSRTLAMPRTLATRIPEPVPAATIVDLSAPPRLVKTDLFIDDSLADELSTGRLADLLAAAEASGADWVLDAGLLAEVRDMADGYRVQTDDGNTAGTRADIAQAWLERLTALDPDRGRLGLLGTPDLVAATRAGDEAILDHARRATDRVVLEGVAPVVVLKAPDAPAAAAAGQGRGVIALDSPALPVHTTLDGTDVLAASPAAPDLSRSPLLADTATNRQAVALALGRARGGVLRWLTSSEDAATATDAPPAGHRAATLAELAALPPQDAPAPEGQDAPEASGPVTADSIPDILALGRRLASYGDLAPDAGIAEVADAQVARAASVWWAGADAERATWLAAIDRRVQQPEDDPVRLDATPRFSMTGATSDFPVTVTNRLPDPVTLLLRTETDYPQRIRFADTAPVTVAPGASSTVVLQAQAAGGGVVRARVHAETLTGHRLTPDAEIVVETTSFGVIGWVLVIGSAIVLVATTAIRIRQVRKRQKKGADD